MIEKVFKEVATKKMIDFIELREVFVVNGMVEFDSLEKAQRYENRFKIEEAFNKLRKLEFNSTSFLFYLHDAKDLQTIIDNFEMRSYDVVIPWKLDFPCYVELDTDYSYKKVMIDKTELVEQSRDIMEFVNTL